MFPHTQGRDQLKYDVSTLILLSGMKDGLSYISLEISDTEFVAGDSENTMISEKEMKEYLEKYPRVLVCFDSDSPGREAMTRYSKKYNIQPIHLEMEDKKGISLKDVFDCRASCGHDALKNKFISLLK